MKITLDIVHKELKSFSKNVFVRYNSGPGLFFKCDEQDYITMETLD